MKASLLLLIGLLAGCGCKSIDSLIIHPLKVLHQMHENNEGERRKPAPAIHPETNENHSSEIRVHSRDSRAQLSLNSSVPSVKSVVNPL